MAVAIDHAIQATEEKLQASKEELQSLNGELTTLNGQLQTALALQQTLSDDLQNVLYSTHVATLFLDLNLNLRFFTPAAKLQFNVIASDIGRPIADLSSLAADGNLLMDADTVLRTLVPFEREIDTHNGDWYVRRILPYRTHDNTVGGVVITFVDTTDRRRIADALEAANQRAQAANVAKSRFLAAASHDLRQPLQTLSLLQGLLAHTVSDDKSKNLVGKLDKTLSAMSGMLNALLDINQIEAGTVQAEISEFPINDLLDRLRDEFTYHAQARRLDLRVVGCGASIRSDPRLLEQMVRNLLANALKYTKRGKVLLGCRQHAGMLTIEVWDTGIGIAANEQQAIFEEYHQLDNEARERSRGLGLGLSIVQRLGTLLEHGVRVRSTPGKGSVFIIEIAMPQHVAASVQSDGEHGAGPSDGSGDTILMIEDDPEIGELLEVLLIDAGHRVFRAMDGVAALALVAQKNIQPDLVMADYNLPNGLNGLQLIAALRETLRRQVPAIILTGDISTRTLRDVAVQDCVQFNKPVKVKELTQTIERLLLKPVTQIPARIKQSIQMAGGVLAPVIYVVDDDHNIREMIRAVLEDDGRIVEDYESAEAFLDAYHPGPAETCLLVDAYLPGMSGLDLLHQLRQAGHELPSIMITGNSDVATAVQAMQAGALDFVEKPVSRDDLLAGVSRALEQSRDSSKLTAWREKATHHVAGLTPRQREIMDMVLAGHPSKNIAADLGISQRTVENHRASIMKKTGSKSLPALARLALAATRIKSGEAAD